jgi:hypothetical protein
MAVSVGFSRNEAGQPVMLEKAHPTSERIFGEWGPSHVDQLRQAGHTIFWDGVGDEHAPERRYSHSSADLS